MASGHVSRANRPNTWLHRPALHVKKTLASREPFSNRSSFVKNPCPSLSLAPGSWFSSRSTVVAASSGSKRWPSNVHNGLVEVALCGPTASRGVAGTLAPEGKLTVPAILPDDCVGRFRRLSLVGPSGMARLCARSCAG